MESKFGLENMAKEAAIGRMIQAHEKEMYEIARISTMLKQSRPIRPAWYCPLLVGLGERLVALGMHLKSHYSLRMHSEKDAWKYHNDLVKPHS